MIEVWKLKPLEQIVTLQRGFDLPTQDRAAGSVAVIGSNGKVGTHNVAPNGIPVPGLMVGRSGSVGKLTYWEKDYWPLNTSLYVKDFKGNDPKFLSYWLQLFPFKQYAEGVSVPTLNRNSVNDIAFPLPEEEDQKSIARTLDLVCQCIDRQRDLWETAQELKRATMRELFTRGLRGEAQKDSEIGPVPARWTVAKIGEVALRAQYGMSLRGQLSGQYPILRMNCQDDGKVVMRNLQYVDLDDGTFQSFKLEPGDILFNRTNSIELVGRTAIFESEESAVFASYLVRLAVDRTRCLPKYLNYFMNWPNTQIEIKKLASRAVGQANINASKLRTVSFPLPPNLEEQAEIVAILGAIDAKIDLHKRKQALLEELFRALLHKLMTGEVRVADLDLSALDQGAAA